MNRNVNLPTVVIVVVVVAAVVFGIFFYNTRAVNQPFDGKDAIPPTIPGVNDQPLVLPPGQKAPGTMKR